MWGRFSHTKGWIFVDTNYIWYQVLLVLLLLDLWQQIFYNCKYTGQPDVHSRLIASLLPVTIITKEKHPIYVSADHGYDDDHELYDLSTDMGFQLVGMSSTEIWKYYSADRIKLVNFMNLKLDRLSIQGNVNQLNRW